MRLLWQAAQADDPYADGYLLRIDRALASVRKEVGYSLELLQKRMASDTSIPLPEAISNQPLRIPLTFSTPYGYQGAYLLAEYDRFTRLLIAARHYGLLPPAEMKRQIEVAGKRLKTVFGMPLSYRLTGATRADIVSGTDKAIKAKTAMGEVPHDVLEGRTRSPHAPRIRR
jgi:integrating conjugative element protein (TIGR03761 family)